MIEEDEVPRAFSLQQYEGAECIYLDGPESVHGIIHDIAETNERISAEVHPIPTPGFWGGRPGAWGGRGDSGPWEIRKSGEHARITATKHYAIVDGANGGWSICFGRDLIHEVVTIMDSRRHGWLLHGAALRALLPSPRFKVEDRPWIIMQGSIHNCAVCLEDPCFVPNLPRYCRPWNPVRKERLLLMSEAPPEAGGFWHLSEDRDSQEQDDLRTQLLTLLEEHGLTRHSGSDEFRELRSFMESGLFLIQTLKWPLGTTFNHLSKSNQTRVIEHAVNAHLRQEILTIAPARVLAMGSAALSACRLLSKDPSSIPAGGVNKLRRKNGTLSMSFAGQDIPVDVTFLPVGQNMRLPNRANIIKQDVASFLSRRGWSAQGSSWAGSPPRDHPLRRRT